ncbi:hypothetical protein ElyMa_003439800 [Elysia marginata]|uniref:Uncharacterized protein n=1 Tax=Elysia marginata TaxID=1093978 RepID=A0AAV4JTP9_9GAST|nr:hypothetical protein ElyMa_003439800 [Elysia marginata]
MVNSNVSTTSSIAIESKQVEEMADIKYFGVSLSKAAHAPPQAHIANFCNSNEGQHAKTEQEQHFYSKQAKERVIAKIHLPAFTVLKAIRDPSLSDPASRAPGNQLAFAGPGRPSTPYMKRFSLLT